MPSGDSPLGGYSTREVASMLGVSPRRVRSLVQAEFLVPRRTTRGHFRFSFQDLVLLRTAHGLAEAGIPPARVRGALAALRRQLPRGRSLTAVRITAEGGRVVVRDRGDVWEPETGQRPLPLGELDGFEPFAVAELAERAAPLSRGAVEEAARHPEQTAEDWYELGYELEATAPEEARDAYRRALELDPAHADAHLNLGRLCHEEGETAAAEACYRQAAALRPADPTPWFNLGVALQDLARADEAMLAYERCLAADPSFADAHFNLAGLHSQGGDRAAALRHLKSYKRLVGG